MYFVVGYPLNLLTQAIEGVLNSVSGTSAVLMGCLISLLQIDLGGALSHVQYAFVVGALGSGIAAPMAAVMVSGMCPPIGLAIATFLRPKLWSQDEREAGKACLLLGFSFITEGVIPFATSYPLQILPATLIGNAIGASMSLLAGVEVTAPHGGLFLLAIPGVISNVPAWLAAIAVDSLVTAALIVVLMGRRRKKEAAEVATA